jgi:catechol 2,3-dioxygenase-like lactoylglutathione lyase family enzyme
MHFLIVDLSNSTSLDYMESPKHVAMQHFAFLVGDEEFEPILASARALVPQIWADPARTLSDQINTRFNGRGFYFEDPNGHLLEVITRPYGYSGP